MNSHLGLYGVCRSDGAPFLRPDGSVDLQVVADHARFGTVILEASPLLICPDIVAALRAANPAVRVIAFMDLEKAYFSPGHSLDPANDLTRALYEAAANVPDGRGFAWSARWGDIFDPIRLTGRPIPPEASYSWYGRNLASPQCADATAQVINERIIGSGLFDGLFTDLAYEDIVRTSVTGNAFGDMIDFGRAGFGSLADFSSAFRAGHRAIWRRLHDLAPDGFLLCMNPAPSDPTLMAYVNGGMNEGWPTAPGDRHDAAAWLELMKGIWSREKARGGSAENWINMQPDWGGLDWTVEANAGAISFGLASACLTDSARFTMSMNGRPDPDGRERRWSELYDFVAGLGAPLGPAYAAAGGRWVREFSGGLVLVDPKARSGRFYGVAA